MTATRQALLLLVRLGGDKDQSPTIWNDCCQDKVDWLRLFDLAREQGVDAICVDGLARLADAGMAVQFKADSPEEDCYFKALGTSMHLEMEYRLYHQATTDLARLMMDHGIDMVVLKGLSCGACYPRPDHRSYGDMDLYFGDRWRDADKIIADKGIEIDKRHHHHTCYAWQGFMVENHYDFFDIHAHRSSKRMEAYLKTLPLKGWQTSWDWYLPSAQLHATFLLHHSAAHFAGAGLVVRHLLDWYLFKKVEGDRVDWQELERAAVEFGKDKFLRVMEHLCEFLFVDSSYPLDEVEQRVLADMFSEAPREGWRRWWSRQWKYRLSYSDNGLVDDFTMLWSHIIRPNID